MKKKTKLLITLLLFAAFLTALSISAFASEPYEAETDSTAADESETGEACEAAQTEENAFALLYGFAVDNADKIFSCLAFIGALILSFAYKKGLFPFVEKALSSLTGAVKSLREESEKSSTENSVFLKSVTEKLAESESILENASAKIAELEEKLCDALKLNEKTDEFRAVMLAEVEMIYNIFISSSLPQYQKDKVGEAYSKMKEKLSGKEG